MAPALARFVLLGASVAILAACFVEGRLFVLAGALAAAAFPPALLLLAERDSVPPWIGTLAASLVTGMLIAVFWRGSPLVAGLPLATWLTWLLLGAVPFALIVYGVVLRDAEHR